MIQLPASTVLDELNKLLSNCEKHKTEGGKGYDPAIDLYRKTIDEIQWLRTLCVKENVRQIELFVVKENDEGVLMVVQRLVKEQENPCLDVIHPSYFFLLFVRLKDDTGYEIKRFKQAHAPDDVVETGMKMAEELNVPFVNQELVKPHTNE